MTVGEGNRSVEACFPPFLPPSPLFGFRWLLIIFHSFFVLKIEIRVQVSAQPFNQQILKFKHRTEVMAASLRRRPAFAGLHHTAHLSLDRKGFAITDKAE